MTSPSQILKDEVSRMYDLARFITDRKAKEELYEKADKIWAEAKILQEKERNAE